MSDNKYLSMAEAIAAEHNINTVWRQCRGYSFGKDRRVECPEPRGYKSFFTFLHEVGHIVHPQGGYQGSGNPAKTRALAEYNATVWAKEKLRELGLPVKRKVSQSYDLYVKDKIARGLRRGGAVPTELKHMAKGITRDSYFY